MVFPLDSVWGEFGLVGGDFGLAFCGELVDRGSWSWG